MELHQEGMLVAGKHLSNSLRVLRDDPKGHRQRRGLRHDLFEDLLMGGKTGTFRADLIASQVADDGGHSSHGDSVHITSIDANLAV